MYIEIFPTKDACPAGCVRCPLSRRVGAERSNPVDSNILTSFKALEEILLKINHPYAFIYAGPSASLSEHIISLVHEPQLIKTLRYAFDPKDTTPFAKLLQEIKSQDTHIHGALPNLALEELAATIYPKDPYKLSLHERRFTTNLFQIMKEFHILGKKPTLKVELHANMIKFQEFVDRMQYFERNDYKTFDSIANTIIEKRGSFPDLIQKNYLVTSWLGLAYESSFVIASFIKDYMKWYVENRIIAPQTYGEEWTKLMIAIHQGQQILMGDTIVKKPGISFAPEGVMIQHSSIYVTNPVIWISHEEFRELLCKYGTSIKGIGEMSKFIIETNLEFLKTQLSLPAFKTSIHMFRAMRQEKKVE
jgi:hypothetical protein